MIDRSIAPAAKPILNINLPEAESVKLSNGTRLYAINWGEQPVMSIDLFFDASFWHEQLPAQSYLCLRMIQEGTNGRTAVQIAEFLAGYGAYLELSHTPDRVHITLHCLTRFLPVLAPFLYELITEANFPERELEIQQNNLRQQLQINQARSSYLASKAFKAALFGTEHPYGTSLEAVQLDAISTTVLKSHYERCILNGPLQIIVAGAIGETEYKIIDQVFGNRSVFKAKTKNVYPAHTPPAAPILVSKPEAKQSSIRLGRVMFTRNHPDFFKFRILSEVFGGYFGSRLMRNIREEKGFTYGIYAQAVPLENDGYFVISADVSAENTSEAIAEIAKEARILQTELIDPEELETVRNYMLGSFANSLNTPFALADRFKAVYFNGLGYEYYQNLLQSIRETTAEQLLETANKYLNIGDYTEVVVGQKQ